MRLTVTTFQNLAVSYVCLWATAPVLAYGTGYRVLAVLAVVVWVGLEMSRARGIMNRPTLPVILALIFISYTGLMELMLSGAEGLLSHLQIWIMLFFLIVHQSRRDDLQSLMPVFWFVLAALPLWLFATFYTLTYVDAHAARVIVRSGEEAMRFSKKGVGGYSLVYGTLLMLPALLVLVLGGLRLECARLPHPLQRVPRLAQAILLLNVGLGLAVILSAGYTIAVTGLAGAVVGVIFLKRYVAWRLLLFFVGAVFAGILYKSFLEFVLNALMPLAEGTNFAPKIRDMLNSLHLREAVGTAGVRAERYMRSLMLFFDNPLIGVLAVDDVGKHSEILDTYARWGVLFGSIFIYLVSFLPVRAIRKLTGNFGSTVATLFVVIVTFGLNNGFAAAGVMLYIIFPLATYLQAGKEQRVVYARRKLVHA